MNICDSQYVVIVGSGFWSAPKYEVYDEIMLQATVNKIYGSKIVCKGIVILALEILISMRTKI